MSCRRAGLSASHEGQEGAVPQPLAAPLLNPAGLLSWESKPNLRTLPHALFSAVRWYPAALRVFRDACYRPADQTISISGVRMLVGLRMSVDPV